MNVALERTRVQSVEINGKPKILISEPICYMLIPEKAIPYYVIKRLLPHSWPTI
jgi:hypothetical protein